MNEFELAKQVPIGQRRKVPHHCGDGTPLMIGQTAEILWWKCYRCQQVARVQEKVLTLEQKTALLQADKELLGSTTVNYPTDATTELPVTALSYLGVRNVSASVALSRGVKYSPSMDRLLIPQFKDGNLVSLGARLMRWRRGDVRPKFLTLGAQGGAVPICVNTCTDGLEKSVIILTEDLLSSWAVAKVQHSASVVSTSMNAVQASTLLYDYPKVIVWLDGDEAGESGSVAIRRTLELLGKEVVDIWTPLDPKYYSTTELIMIIGGALYGRKAVKNTKVQRRLSEVNHISRYENPRWSDAKYTGRFQTLL